MKWLRRLFPTQMSKDIINFAHENFEKILAEGDHHSATVYANEPAKKAEAWNIIKKDIQEFLSDPNANLALLMRGKITEQLELLITAHWYNNLNPDERFRYLRFIEKNTKLAEEDAHYYYGHAYHYVYVRLLHGMILFGYDAEGLASHSTDYEEVYAIFKDCCQDHCDLIYQIAKFKNDGIEMPDSEIERGKTTILLKELSKKTLAGIPLDDDESITI